jgi:DNA polymerase III delta prime subunit
MSLCEKYRPKAWPEFVGQEKAVKMLQHCIGRWRASGESDAVWLSGGSGMGKTTAARIIAADLGATDMYSLIEYNGKFVRANIVQEIERMIWFCPPSGGWKVIIIDEAHLMTDGAVEAMLNLLEKLPARRLFIFTSTSDLLQKAPNESEKNTRPWVDWGEHNGPMARRCKRFPFTNQGIGEPGAAMLKKIAETEGLDGQDIAKYRRHLSDCGNNLGLALNEIEMGVML